MEQAPNPPSPDRLSLAAAQRRTGEVAPSPCAGVCTINPLTGLCSKCYRTMYEIARWPTMLEPEKLFVWVQIEFRQKLFPSDIKR